MKECVNTFSTSDIIAVCAVVIAILSLFAIIWQSYLTRRHNFLSVKPHLDIKLYLVPEHPIKIQIINNGVGPAIIKNVSIPKPQNRKQKLEVDSPKLFFDLFLEKKSSESVQLVTTVTALKNSSIPSNGSIDYFVIENSDINPELFENIKNMLKNIELEIEYECVYGIKYNTETNT